MGSSSCVELLLGTGDLVVHGMCGDAGACGRVRSSLELLFHTCRRSTSHVSHPYSTLLVWNSGHTSPHRYLCIYHCRLLNLRCIKILSLVLLNRRPIQCL